MAKRKRNKKLHPWRRCPKGQHWRNSTYVEAYLKGDTIIKGHFRKGSCVKNPSRKDQIYKDELHSIAQKNFIKFSSLSNKGLSKFSQSKKFDHLIQGWTKYWNEVLKPKVPLDPLLVKALIATESSFKSRAKVFAGKRAGYARGLMQVTDWTIEILEDEKGELKDFLVNVDQKDMNDPNLNLAAGIRWLFRKQETASAKLNKPADWIWTAADYKSYLREFQKNPKHKQMNKLIKIYETLKKGE
ncbi:MAG: lytic transglycosylase domain-containing protein [Bdellovibrionales bacterium]|nr:lytic transglycosylase domain-containing protein [Bdellovibrionales bacterium]